MLAPSPPLRRGPLERLTAWLMTGPLGHLWSVVADLAGYLFRFFLARARESVVQRRLAGAGSRLRERR